MESGENAGPLLAHNLTQVSVHAHCVWVHRHMTKMSACAHKHMHMLECMHTIFWCAQAHISVKLGQIREIKVSIESGEQAGTV